MGGIPRLGRRRGCRTGGGIEFLNPTGTLPRGSTLKGEGREGSGTRELGFRPLCRRKPVRTHPPPSRVVNPGDRGRGFEPREAKPGRWPESFCLCIDAAGTLHGRELHLQGLCHHGRDGDERQDYPKPTYRVCSLLSSQFSHNYAATVTQVHVNIAESRLLTPNNSYYNVIKANIWGLSERKCSILLNDCTLEPDYLKAMPAV